MEVQRLWSALARLVPIGLAGYLAACQAFQSQQQGPPRDDFAATAAQPVQLGESTGELSYDGRQRTYTLYTPKSYQRDYPMPLVLAFHGYGSQGKDLAQNTDFNRLAEQKGFVVVYPDGIERRWNPLNKVLTGVDDVGFVPALIDHMKQVREIDPQRIYAAGVSNGGFLVQRLACESSTEIAAFASVVASFPTQFQFTCRPRRSVPILMMNGTEDRKVPWQGGNLFYGSILSVPDSIDFWRVHNNCPSQPQIKRLAGGRVEIARYMNCHDNTEVELVKLEGAGHVWPKGGSGPSQLLNGSQEIWNFFQRHPK